MRSWNYGNLRYCTSLDKTVMTVKQRPTGKIIGMSSITVRRGVSIEELGLASALRGVGGELGWVKRGLC